MKKAIGIFIFFVLLLQCCAHYSTIALYRVRKDYIARNLCENRNKPELKCYGKCCLKRQLKKIAAENDGKNDTVKTENWESVLYVLPLCSILEKMFIKAAEQPYNPTSQHMSGYSPLCSVFHPPSKVMC